MMMNQNYQLAWKARLKARYCDSVRCMCMKMQEPSPRARTVEAEFSHIPKQIVGQPTCHTHPHMIQPGYLTSSIKLEEYIERRDTLVTKLVEKSDIHASHIIVIPGAVKQYMSDNIPYPFRQNSDFYYLTGCLEPGAILVMMKPVHQDTYNAVLFVNEKDPHLEMWEGPQTGTKAAAQLFGVNEAQPKDNFKSYLASITKQKPAVLWYNMQGSANKDLNNIITTAMHEAGSITWSDPQKAIHSMRVIKSPAEIELMVETCLIGAQSINMAMSCSKPGMSERSMNAILDFTSRQGGAEQLAFPPVVAGGPRATHIHYVTNDQLLRDDEMVLVDTGCQRWLYNSDISRTWPVSGTFSKYHRILYEIVLSVQKRLIEMLGERQQPLDHLFDDMCRLLGTCLQQEGILPKNISGNELVSKTYRLCPHHVSHYLGLDVHDSHLVRRNIPIEPNMIVTVEPGLYIKEDDTSVRAEFRGIGIRVEDDVLITTGAPVVLTDACAKEVADIEAIVGKHKV